MKNKRSIILLTVIALSYSIRVSAQEEKPQNTGSKFEDRIITGGNIGLQFGTQTMIDISPLIGYKITKRFVAGAGISYRYYRNNVYGQIFKTTIYGGSIFSRFYILDNLFLHAEYEGLSLETQYFDPYYPPLHTGNRFWIGSPLAGAGYSQAIGGKSSFDLIILYNFNDSQYSPYNNPIIRAGFSLGL